MSYMFCFECGIKFDGGVRDLYDIYDIADGHMKVPFCKEHSLNLNKESLK